MNITESVLLAIDSIRVNKLRASLTLLSIAIGVFAIIGAGSLINSLNAAVEGELSAMGETSFSIFRMPHIQMGNTWRKYRNRKPINYSQFKDFKRGMTRTDIISVACYSSGNMIKYGNNETDPDVVMIGTDEHYFNLRNLNVMDGRALTTDDITLNRNVIVLGNDIVVKCFPHENPIGKRVNIKNHQFTVIGVLEIKGALLGQSQDNYAIIPVTQLLRYYTDEWEESLEINMKAYSKDELVSTMDEAVGVMRTVRNVKPWQENSFEIETNESLSQQFAGFTSYLSYFGMICGIIALIAAGVGIMNIMLVSVKERTREIGVRKAVGAKRYWIMIQFLIETITLCQVGNIIGILIGMAASSYFGNMMGLNLTLAWNWIIACIIFCTVLGIASGAYPAWKAAKLDPIDALRYE